MDLIRKRNWTEEGVLSMEDWIGPECDEGSEPSNLPHDNMPEGVKKFFLEDMEKKNN